MKTLNDVISFLGEKFKEQKVEGISQALIRKVASILRKEGFMQKSAPGAGAQIIREVDIVILLAGILASLIRSSTEVEESLRQILSLINTDKYQLKRDLFKDTNLRGLLLPKQFSEAPLFVEFLLYLFKLQQGTSVNLNEYFKDFGVSFFNGRFTAWISIKKDIIIKGNFYPDEDEQYQKIFFTDLIEDHASPLLYKMYIHKSVSIPFTIIFPELAKSIFQQGSNSPCLSGFIIPGVVERLLGKNE